MIRSYQDIEPTIADSAYVDPAATVIGDVTIEADASVWPGVVLRGDHGEVVLHERVNVQDNSTLHEGVELAPDVTVGHNAIVHAATVETGALVGMGAVVLDGATVGANSVVGANSIVTEGTDVPESVLVAGTPAEEIKAVEGSPGRMTAEGYVDQAREHAKSSEELAEAHYPIGE